MSYIIDAVDFCFQVSKAVKLSKFVVESDNESILSFAGKICLRLQIY